MLRLSVATSVESQEQQQQLTFRCTFITVPQLTCCNVLQISIQSDSSHSSCHEALCVHVNTPGYGSVQLLQCQAVPCTHFVSQCASVLQQVLSMH